MASVPRPDPPSRGPTAHPDIHAHRILILDFGAQYTQLIARRVREFGVYCEILPWDIDDAEVRAFAPRGVILSGGPESVTQADAPYAPPAVYELGVPVLGICYGTYCRPWRSSWVAASSPPPSASSATHK